jgi:predicted Zn finger-like uncharacterized protein
MRIACPQCAAEYDVPDAALAAGPRTLKCARCAHQFQASLPSPAAPAPAASFPAAPKAPPPDGARPAAARPDALAERSAAPDRPPPSRGPTQSMPIDPPLPRLGDAPASPTDRFALLGWLLTVAVVVVGLLAGYAFRAEIMAAWPPATRLFAALGLN